MGIFKNKELPKPPMEQMEARDKAIAEAERQLEMIKQERAKIIQEQPQQPPLPPKFETKTEFVPVAWEEIISIQMEGIKTELDEIKRLIQDAMRM